MPLEGQDCISISAENSLTHLRAKDFFLKVIVNDFALYDILNCAQRENVFYIQHKRRVRRVNHLILGLEFLADIA